MSHLPSPGFAAGIPLRVACVCRTMTLYRSGSRWSWVRLLLATHTSFGTPPQCDTKRHTGCWLLAARCWLLAVGCLLLAAGWLLVQSRLCNQLVYVLAEMDPAPYEQWLAAFEDAQKKRTEGWSELTALNPPPNVAASASKTYPETDETTHFVAEEGRVCGDCDCSDFHAKRYAFDA